MHIVVIAVQNSQVNKKIGELNFGINNTFKGLMPCWNVVINVSFSTGTYKPVHSSSLPWAKPFYKPLSNEAVYLSTRTELNHRNYIVYSV